jgi:hypothetical protein
MNNSENKLLLPRYDTVFKSIFKDENNRGLAALGGRQLR